MLRVANFRVGDYGEMYMNAVWLADEEEEEDDEKEDEEEEEKRKETGG